MFRGYSGVGENCIKSNFPIINNNSAIPLVAHLIRTINSDEEVIRKAK